LRGKLHIAEPLNACKPLTNGPSAKEKNPFVVIGSGQCNNVLKVKNAQNAGFMAVLLFNVEDEPEFINSKALSLWLCSLRVMIFTMQVSTFRK
jgi:E3 ubiquitin-protein ligase RNF13